MALIFLFLALLFSQTSSEQTTTLGPCHDKDEQIKSQQKSIADKDAVIANNRRDMDSQVGEIQDYKSRLRHVNATLLRRVSDHEAQIAEQQARIEELESILRVSHAEAFNLTRTVNSQKQSLKQKNDIISLLTNEETQISEQNQTFRAKEDTFLSIAGEVVHLRAETISQNVTIRRFSDTIDSQNEEISVQSRKIADQQTKLGGQSEAIQTCQHHKGLCEGTEATLRTEVERLIKMTDANNQTEECRNLGVVEQRLKDCVLKLGDVEVENRKQLEQMERTKRLLEQQNKTEMASALKDSEDLAKMWESQFYTQVASSQNLLDSNNRCLGEKKDLLTKVDGLNIDYEAMKRAWKDCKLALNPPAANTTMLQIPQQANLLPEDNSVMVRIVLVITLPLILILSCFLFYFCCIKDFTPPLETVKQSLPASPRTIAYIESPPNRSLKRAPRTRSSIPILKSSVPTMGLPAKRKFGNRSYGSETGI